MPHDFEKNYPLPFRVHVFQEKLFQKPKTLMVYAGNGYYVFSSRLENRFDVFKYMVSCANLMPEAVELLKYLRETMLEDASWVQIEGEKKHYSCDEELERIDNFLAKNFASVSILWSKGRRGDERAGHTI